MATKVILLSMAEEVKYLFFLKKTFLVTKHTNTYALICIFNRSSKIATLGVKSIMSA